MRRHQNSDAEKVGYGRPPVQTRFQPGQSGNPRGRPKNQRNMRTEIQEVYLGKISITGPDGKTIKIPRVAALLRANMAKALKGDAKATLLLFRIGEMFGVFDVIPRAPTMKDFIESKEHYKVVDDKLLAAILRKYQLKREGKPDNVDIDTTAAADLIYSIQRQVDKQELEAEKKKIK